MKRTAIDKCVQAYREGVEAYSALEKNLRAADSAAADIPLRIPSVREARARLAEAYPILSKLGEALAFLPALAIQLAEEQQISEPLRAQTLRAGKKYRDGEQENPDRVVSDRRSIV